jgi:hypothetical protein
MVQVNATRDGDIVEDGPYRFKVVKHWSKELDPPLARAIDVGVDSQDLVYLGLAQHEYPDKGNVPGSAMPLVIICDEDGNQLSSWGTGATLAGHGLRVAHDMVYVCDRDGAKALIYTLDGKIIRVIGEHRTHSDTGALHKGEYATRTAGPFNCPAQIVPSPWGDLYVADGYKNARVHRFHSNGQYINSWGRGGRRGAGRFHVPHSVLAINGGHGEGRVYVASRFGDNVQVFDRYGNFVDLWKGLRTPSSIVQLPDGNIAVAEHQSDYYLNEVDFDVTAKVTIFTPDGQRLASLPLGYAHGMAADSKGNLYLADHHTVAKCISLD